MPRVAKHWRQFGGETFTFFGFSVTKKKAKERATELRKQGWLVRVVELKHPRHWVIYRRKK